MKSYKFSGTAFLTVDEKSRLLVPADVRRRLEDGVDTDVFIIKIGPNGKPWMWPEKFYDAKVYDDGSGLEVNDINPSDDQMELMISRSADLHRVTMDKQGRILLPDLVMELTGTGREVALLGVFNHLQLWNRSDYAKRQMAGQQAKQAGG